MVRISYLYNNDALTAVSSLWWYSWWAMKNPRFWRGLRKELEHSSVYRPTELAALDNLAFESWVGGRLRESDRQRRKYIENYN